MAATTTQRHTRYLACALALLVLAGTAVGVAAAAGTTNVVVSPETDSLEQGDTTTVDLVVESTDGGVGALNATVAFSNPDVASVEDVTIHGDPGVSNATERPDGVALSAALGDTDDTGSVTVATVLVAADEPGTTALDVTVDVLGDENGAAYAVGSVDRPTITVAVDGSGSSEDDSRDDGVTPGDDGSNGDATDGTDAPSIENDGSNGDDSATEAPTDERDGDRSVGGSESGQAAGGPVTVERFAASLPGQTSHSAALAVGAIALGALVIHRIRRF